MDVSLRGRSLDDGPEYEVTRDTFGPFVVPIREILDGRFTLRLLGFEVATAFAAIEAYSAIGNRRETRRPEPSGVAAAAEGPAWLRCIRFEDAGRVVSVKGRAWEDVHPEIYDSFKMIVEATRRGEDVSREALPIRAKAAKNKRPDRLFARRRFKGEYQPLWGLIDSSRGPGNGYHIVRKALERFLP